MHWLEALHQQQANHTACVLVTLLAVRGHAPREAGAKMVVTANASFDTIGGGNLEQTAIELARGLLETTQPAPFRHTIRLTHEHSLYGVQCCGGEVEMLLEPVLPKPNIAIFGLGHVGFALAQVLALLPMRLWLVDSRPEMLLPSRLEGLAKAATLELCFTPVPDGIVADLPSQTKVVILTHDHAEDLYVLKAALKRHDLSEIGLIGSNAKWQRFQRKLLEEGFGKSDLERVTCPIGSRTIASKNPAAIAIGVAAKLLEQTQLASFVK